MFIADTESLALDMLKCYDFLQAPVCSVCSVVCGIHAVKDCMDKEDATNLMQTP